MKKKSIFDKKKIFLKLSFEIKKGYHLNSNQPLQEYLIPTKLEFFKNDQLLENVEMYYPKKAIKEIDGEKVSWYSGKIDFFIIIKGQKKIDNIQFLLSYQSCNDEGSCYPPAEISESIKSLDLTDGEKENLLLSFKEKTKKPSTKNDTTTTKKPFLLAMLFFAFLGGILLNFMPCVLPIFSLKIYGLIAKKETKKERITISIFYTLGILFSFLLLWIFIAVLLSLGKNIGWGFHFQEPIFVVMIAVVVLLVMLNQWNLLPIPAFGVNQTVNSNRSLSSKSFFEGLFISVMSTSCSAPLLSVAVSFAISQTILVIGLILFSIGLGFATPMVALYWFTWLRKIFPKPGNWLIVFKNLIGFSLLAVLIWLCSVFYQLSDWFFYQRFLWLLFFISIFSAIYALLIKKKPSKSFLFFIILIVIHLLFILLFFNFKQKKDIWQPLNQTTYNKYVENKQKGTIVFIEFTAAWCFTCQFNKKWILEDNEIEKNFIKKEVILLRADMTKKNKYLDNLLEKYQRKSIPVYVFYGKEETSEPIVLDLLTKGKLLKILSK